MSLGWIAAYGIGCLVWLLYGISTASVPLIVCEVVSLITVSATIQAIRHVRTADAQPMRGREVERDGAMSAASAHERAAANQVTVARAIRQHPGSSLDFDLFNLAVVDQRRRAHGRVSFATLVKTPTAERAELLIAEITEESDDLRLEEAHA